MPQEKLGALQLSLPEGMLWQEPSSSAVGTNMGGVARLVDCCRRSAGSAVQHARSKDQGLCWF